jgi:hypothetical protein
MPTTRARHMITETHAIELMLDDAAGEWPALRDDRAGLVRRLIELGAETVHARNESRRAERRQAIRETSGMFDGMWPDDAVQRMRDEWPE